ncbi:lipopolysaccharide assembly protein LapB [Dysgonomonas sp. 25]|uniref:tetratricopeptide repeat protein n=1 Tax=Dysgonomonas sp. 25 TaxID=2302933 RepID=UPI0013D2FC57|nr:tetratricopeptide repeat protein [Dysgonomonas sp. 25]NDV68397.1 hypothetical protein [Dysgonomonas sp. 25]
MKKLILILILLAGTLAATAQTYEEMVSKAMDFAEQNDYVGAELAMKAALRAEPANPGNSLLLFNLGTFQRNQGKLEEALISYNAAIAKFPNPSMLLHSRAALYCEMNQWDNAFIDYSSLIASDPKDMEALYRRGLIFLMKDDIISAENDFGKMLEIDAENLQGKMAMAMILKGQEKWEEAEVAYTYLLSNNKANADLYLNRAECYFQQKKLGRALVDIESASKYGYNGAPLYLLRGQIRLEQFDKPSAREDFLKAKEMGASPEIVDPLLKLAAKK